MSLGYDVKEVDRDYSISGVTGKVTKFMMEEMEFPCIVIDMTKQIPSKPKLDLLATLFSNVNADSIVGNPITVSALIQIKPDDDSTINYKKLGKVQPRQVKSLLKMFLTGESPYEVFAYTDKNTKLEGALVYALAD